MNKATILCTIIVATCAAIVLCCEKLFPSSNTFLVYKVVSGYLVLLTLYFLSQFTSEVVTFFKSHSYAPKELPDDKSKIIYLNQQEEWFEVG